MLENNNKNSLIVLPSTVYKRFEEMRNRFHKLKAQEISEYINYGNREKQRKRILNPIPRFKNAKPIIKC